MIKELIDIFERDRKKMRRRAEEVKAEMAWAELMKEMGKL